MTGYQFSDPSDGHQSDMRHWLFALNEYVNTGPVDTIT